MHFMHTLNFLVVFIEYISVIFLLRFYLFIDLIIVMFVGMLY